MELTGLNYIGFEKSGKGKDTFQAINPANGYELPVVFFEATKGEIHKAIEKAELAFRVYRKKSGLERAAFLDQISLEIQELGDDLIDRCHEETGLQKGRLIGERKRTILQLQMFAGLLREGSWIDARIDTAMPERKPAPKPDIRQMQVPLGPVGVFGASNFPLAFSVVGGDTASALASGCTLVAKAHPAHPGTSEYISKAINKAAKKTDMPDGVFSLVHGYTTAAGVTVVMHPLIKAIAFTGSFQGGKSLYDVAAKRKVPIPVYAEMSSTNPVFVLPGAIEERKESLALGIRGSVNLGIGQFCTNPGVIFTIESDETNQFLKLLAVQFKTTASGLMLTKTIRDNYDGKIKDLALNEGVEVIASGERKSEGFQGTPHLLQTSTKAFLENSKLEKEVFGPSSIVFNSQSKQEMLQAARQLEGHLTATIHATEEDLIEYRELVNILERRVGRLIINGFPTGVEVCHSMVHGGPYPATTDSRMTSVGTGAITRFTRPFCYQNFPHALLPDALKEDNPLGIWRIKNGARGRS